MISRMGYLGVTSTGARMTESSIRMGRLLAWPLRRLPRQMEGGPAA